MSPEGAWKIAFLGSMKVQGSRGRQFDYPSRNRLKLLTRYHFICVFCQIDVEITSSVLKRTSIKTQDQGK